MSEATIISTILFVGFAILCLALRKKSDFEHLLDTNKGDVVPLGDLTKYPLSLTGPCTATLLRQSGNIYRDLGQFPSVETALLEGTKSFKRAGVDHVRVTHSDTGSIAIYRQVYSFTGRAEGKKLAGLIIKKATQPVAVNEVLNNKENSIYFLKIVVVDTIKESGSVSNVMLNFECLRCGGTVISTDDDEQDHNPVCCKSCSFEFCSLATFREVTNAAAKEHIRVS